MRNIKDVKVNGLNITSFDPVKLSNLHPKDYNKAIIFLLLSQLKENDLVIFEEPELHLKEDCYIELTRRVLELVKEKNASIIISSNSKSIREMVKNFI